MAFSLTRRGKRASAVFATLAAASLALTACGGGEGEAEHVELDTKKDVKIEGSKTFDKISKDGKVVIGVKEDQPGLGYLDAASGERSGFDIEIARWMAAELGIESDKIEYKVVDSANREQALSNGDVDLYVGTYSITDKRKQQVGFVGPYFVTGQGLLVKKDDDSIASEKDLAGKTVCSATGSTPLQNIEENFKDTKAVGMDKYSACVSALMDGTVDAVTTDQAILLGYASNDPDNLKVVGEPFTEELYGVGIPKGETSLCTALSDAMTSEDGKKTWTKIYDATLGKSGTKVDQPEPAKCD